MKKIIALPIALCIACSTGTHRNYPEEVKSYSETVMVPGMSYEDLELKLTLFQARNGDFKYSAETGKYSVSFDIPVSGKSPSEINSKRNEIYAKAAELRKAVYSVPLDKEEELWEQANQFIVGGRDFDAADILYIIAIANPQFKFKSAVAMYAASLPDIGHYEDAIKLLNLVQDVNGVPEMLAEVKALKAEHDAQQAAIAEQERLERQLEAQERMRQWEAQKQENLEKLSENVNKLIASQNKQSSSDGYSSYAPQNSGGGSGKDCYTICSDYYNSKLNYAYKTYKYEVTPVGRSRINAGKEMIRAKQEARKAPSKVSISGCEC